jgi:hypothetical protein
VTTIKVSTTYANVLRDSVALATKRDGEDRFDQQARTLYELGYAIVGHDDVAELEQLRAQQATLPPMVTAAELAALAGVTVQRIYQCESERKASRRFDFPAPVLDGYWLRADAERWAATRKTTPGPVPQQPARRIDHPTTAAPTAETGA